MNEKDMKQARPERPERIHEVLLDAPASVEGLLAEGGSGIGVETPRPAEVSESSSCERSRNGRSAASSSVRV